MSRKLSHIEQEKKTVSIMIEMYCYGHNHDANGLCNECKELVAYAHSRLDHCPYGENKPNCHSCPKHCYRPEMRQKIREVMRWSGPRMIIHPRMLIAYIYRRYFK